VKFSEAQREIYEERAAIMENDGGLDRDTAESGALWDIIRAYTHCPCKLRWQLPKEKKDELWTPRS